VLEQLQEDQWVMVEKINKFDKIECPNHLQPRNYAYHGDGVVQKVSDRVWASCSDITLTSAIMTIEK
jgi:hypothetical protein